jgi:hypothetical protein
MQILEGTGVSHSSLSSLKGFARGILSCFSVNFDVAHIAEVRGEIAVRTTDRGKRFAAFFGHLKE